MRFAALDAEDAKPELVARHNSVGMLSAGTGVAWLDLQHHIASAGTVVGHLDRLERKTADMAEIFHNLAVDILGTMAGRSCTAVLVAAKLVVAGTRVADTEFEVELVLGILAEGGSV